MSRTCGTMDYHNRLLKKSEEYYNERKKIEEFTKEYTKDNHPLADRDIVTIPIVVHIVHQNENIVTDQQIQSQINVLNDDFRAKNTDLINVPSYWKNIIGDTRIEFVLNSITRTRTSVVTFTDDDKVKSAATGGADPSPSNQFLNVWVCDLGKRLLGYASFPGTPPELDGVVINHTAFGSTGSAASPYNLGRTTTHEIGHWLNLYHLWGNHEPNVPLCNDPDYVDDTPNQEMANYNCPTGKVISCNNSPNGAMYMNYMDYTDDSCMYMFTVGQIARMDACLKGPRSSFLQYQSPNPFAGAVSGSSMFIQSNVGAKGNFDVVTPLSTGGLTYFYRNNDVTNFKWNYSYITHAGKFESAKLIQSNFAAPGFPGNFEVIALDDRGHLANVQYDSKRRVWSALNILELYDENNRKLTFKGHPGFLQSRNGMNRNFELVVPLSTQGIVYFFKNNNSSWSKGTVFGTQLGTVNAIGLIQSNSGNLEIIALHDNARRLSHMSYDLQSGWSNPQLLELINETDNSKLLFRGNPAFLQGINGTKGNFELVIPLASGGISYFSRNNDKPDLLWSKGIIFGTELGEVDAVGLIQSNYGSPGNLEVIALYNNGSQLAHLYRDSNTAEWIITDSKIYQ